MENSTPDAPMLPDTARTLQLGDKSVTLLGTAHVSRKSIEDVQAAFALLQPDTVCVELCASRYRALANPEGWQNTDIFKVIREGRAFLLLAQMVMTGFYRHLADHLETPPGGEMMEAIRLAGETNTHLVMADRDVQVTLKRVWHRISWWQKCRLFYHLLESTFDVEKVDAAMIENMKERDQLEGLLDAFGQDLPGAKERLIDERDIYLAQKIREAPGSRILAVVGAGHVPGILKAIQEDHDLQALETVDPPRRTLKALKYVIPALIVVLLCLGFLRGDPQQSLTAIGIWFVVNGALAALGTLLAFGHPLTILAAFLAAPLTSLNPMIAAGWVAGLVQAWIRKPVVADFNALRGGEFSFKVFWKNRVTRVLLVVIFANLGSTAGSIIAASWIASLVLVP